MQDALMRGAMHGRRSLRPVPSKASRRGRRRGRWRRLAPPATEGLPLSAARRLRASCLKERKKTKKPNGYE